jgi:hypothetical protein
MGQYKLRYIDNRVKLLALCNNNIRVQYQQLMQYHLFVFVQFRFSGPKNLLTICGPSARQSNTTQRKAGTRFRAVFFTGNISIMHLIVGATDSTVMGKWKQLFVMSANETT